MAEERTEREILLEAMEKAHEAFQNWINKGYDLDPAFFRLELVGYLLNRDFEKMEKIEWKKQL